MAKVRIKDHDRRIGLSIAVVVGAAVVVWFTWMMWAMSPQERSVQRTLDDMRLLYGCDAGHVVESAGGTRSLPCAVAGCTQRAWPLWTYQCSRHGAQALQLRYKIESGQPRIISTKVPGETWIEVQEDITCPRCERALLPDLSLRRGLLPGTRLEDADNEH